MRLLRPLICLGLTVWTLTLSIGFSQVRAADWNQWRGPSRDGVTAETEWPGSFQGRLNLVWEQPLSPSYSGPVVHDGLVITTETVDKTFGARFGL